MYLSQFLKCTKEVYNSILGHPICLSYKRNRPNRYPRHFTPLLRGGLLEAPRWKRKHTWFSTESGSKFFQSAAQLHQRGCPTLQGAGSGRPRTLQAPQSQGVRRRSRGHRPAAPLPLDSPQPRGHVALMSLWGVPCHYYFQSKLATCRTPLSQATFHQTIPTRHAEGTSSVSETAPNGTAPLWQGHRAPGSAGAANAGAPRWEPGQKPLPQGRGRSPVRCKAVHGFC